MITTKQKWITIAVFLLVLLLSTAFGLFDGKESGNSGKITSANERISSVVELREKSLGGVTASFAMLADVILAEPRARVGFAGPRVIQQTIGQTLPEGFQRSEFQQAHGFVDEIVPRGEMKRVLGRLLMLHEGGVKRA